MSDKLPRASLIEGIRFTAQVAVPNVVQGLFRRRPKAVAVACKLDLDGHAVGLVCGSSRSRPRRFLKSPIPSQTHHRSDRRGCTAGARSRFVRLHQLPIR